MPQTNINIRMDEELKKQFGELCAELGLTMTAAFSVFAKAAVRQKRIPFEVTAATDPFYSEANMKHLRKAIAEFDNPNTPKIIKTMEELEAMADE